MIRHIIPTKPARRDIHRYRVVGALSMCSYPPLFVFSMILLIVVLVGTVSPGVRLERYTTTISMGRNPYGKAYVVQPYHRQAYQSVN
jgi:hypothetical protein